MQLDRYVRAIAIFGVLAGEAGMPASAPAEVRSARMEKTASREFEQRVKQYIKVVKGMPQGRTTKRREEIVDRRRDLAQAIREARIGAKQGDIFSPEIGEQFTRVIRGTLQGPKATNVRRTIRQGEPVADLLLTVNGAYPENLPLTTVPPTLLRRLPELPDRLAYRIVGRDFVLQDTEARLIVDFIPNAIP